jgi:hypothetical protein
MPDPKRQRTGRNNKQRGTHWELVIMREFYNTERNKAGTNKADGCNHPWCIESKSHKGHPPAWLTDALDQARRNACPGQNGITHHVWVEPGKPAVHATILDPAIFRDWCVNEAPPNA